VGHHLRRINLPQAPHSPLAKALNCPAILLLSEVEHPRVFQSFCSALKILHVFVLAFQMAEQEHQVGVQKDLEIRFFVSLLQV
jgi:hypothetical protein